MAKSVLELIVETQQWDGGLKRAQAGLQNFISANKGLSNAIRNHQSTMAGAIAKFGEMGSNAKTASSRLNEMEKMFVELGMRYHEMTAQEKANPVGRATVKSMEQLKARILDTKTAMADLQNQMSVSGGGVSFGSKFMQGIIPGIGMGTGAAAAYVAIRALGMLKDATVGMVRVNAEFEQSNANLSAVLQKSMGEISALTENAKQLGATTLFTANQITGLQTVLARRGFNQDQILQMTHGISNLALATGTGLADSAELAGATMKAFGMEASQAERIVSVLGVSTAKSALTTSKLGVALGYVAPNARAAGYSLEDTVAMLGVLVDSGLDASMAGTALRQIIMAMSTENGKLARSFGRPVRGLNDFREALEHVSNAEDLLSDASKDVRITAVPALISLANNKDRVMELREELEGVNGQLQEMADKQANTLIGSITLLKSAWDGLMISFGESKTGYIKDFVERVTNMLNAATNNMKIAQGGAAAMSVYSVDPSVSQTAAQNVYNDLKGKYSDDAIAGVYEKTAMSQQIRLNDLTDILKFYYTPGDDSVTADRIRDINERVRVSDYTKGDSSVLLEDIRSAMTDLQTSQGIVALATKTAAEDPATVKAAAKPIKELMQNAINEAKAAIDNETDINKIPALKEALKKRQAEYDAVFGEQKEKVEKVEKSDVEKWNEQKAKERARKYAQEQLTKVNTNTYEEGSLADLKNDLEYQQELLDSLAEGTAEYANQMQKVAIAAKLVADAEKDRPQNRLKEEKADLKATKSAWSDAASAISSVGSAMSAIEDPAAKVVGIVAQAIAQVAAGYGAALAKAGATGDAGGPWGWVAFAATGAAAMVSSIAAIKAATEYHADGGFIGGPKGTDVTPMWGTPGELVLNRAQQQNLAGQLVGSARQQNIVITGRLSGRDILLAADNTNRSRGGSRGVYANVK